MFPTGSTRMLSPDEFWVVAAQVVDQRGHLVVGFSADSEKPELGSELHNVLGFKPQQPAMVAAQSDWADWTEQVETFHRLRPNWGRGKSGDPNGSYYRVKFGELGVLSLPVPSFGGYAIESDGSKGESFWPRAGARILDYIFLNLFVLRLAGNLFRFLLITAAGGRPPVWVLMRFSQHHLPLFFATSCGYFAYQTICTIIHGSTLGKRLLSLQVVQDDGSPCRAWSAIMRELAFFVDSFLFGLIGYTAMSANDQHKRHGDKWADTIVRKIPKELPKSRYQAGRFVLGLILGVMACAAFTMTGLLILMSY